MLKRSGEGRPYEMGGFVALSEKNRGSSPSPSSERAHVRSSCCFRSEVKKRAARHVALLFDLVGQSW
jgi:hypothetical protein